MKDAETGLIIVGEFLLAKYLMYKFAEEQLINLL